MATAPTEISETTTYVILVTNNSLSTQDFFFFQQPAGFSGSEPVYCNSLYGNSLRGAGSGAQLKFELQYQPYAGVQTQVTPPVVGQPSGSTTVLRQVELTPAVGTPTDNAYQMLVDPLGLDGPSTDSTVPAANFRIRSATFNPIADQYNLGLGVKGSTGFCLSSFVSAQPQKNTDIQPAAIWYVQTGDFPAGMVVDFSSVSQGAAECDGTRGVTLFDVQYQLDGSWTVNSAPTKGATQMMLRGR